MVLQSFIYLLKFFCNDPSFVGMAHLQKLITLGYSYAQGQIQLPFGDTMEIGSLSKDIPKL